jgi:hypothetical protein
VARTHRSYGRIAARRPAARESSRSWCEGETIRAAFLWFGHGVPQPTREAEQALERGTPLTDYIEAAQRSGRIRDDLGSGWLFEVLVALIIRVATHTRSDLPARGALLRATVCSILAPPSS